MSNKPIVIFFHVATIGNYKRIFKEIWRQIETSGLAEATTAIFISVVGTGKLHVPNHSKITVLRNPSLDSGELQTLCHLFDYSKNAVEPSNILYIHSKGVTAPWNKAVSDWRSYMTYFVVNKWRDCQIILEDFDCCGVDFTLMPKPHYSGNFWWTTTTYLDTLKSPKVYSLSDSTLTPRHNSEFWIGSNSAAEMRSIFNSGLDVYNRHKLRFPRKKYALTK